jgi:hypothetical protein
MNGSDEDLGAVIGMLIAVPAGITLYVAGWFTWCWWIG